MEAISNSVKTVGSKSYIRLYRADPAEKSKEAISLDLAKL